jgi:hypothetical protein
MAKLSVVVLALVVAMPSMALAKVKSSEIKRSCGEFKYMKNGKCEDARNKPREWKAF